MTHTTDSVDIWLTTPSQTLSLPRDAVVLSVTPSDVEGMVRLHFHHPIGADQVPRLIRVLAEWESADEAELEVFAGTVLDADGRARHVFLEAST